MKNHGKYVAPANIKIMNLTKHGGSSKKRLNRSILEQKWSTFMSQLEYKAESAGGRLVKVDPQNTMQRCSARGSLPQERIILKNRWYYCTSCGHSEDRGLDASKNILLDGLKELFDSGGTVPEVLVEGRTMDLVTSHQHRNIVNQWL